MKRVFGYALFILFLSACSTTDYEGFKRLENSIHYKLVVLGNEDQPVSDHTYITFLVAVHELKGKVLAEKRVSRVQLSSGSWSQPISIVLSKCSQGDSVQVIGSIKDLELNKWFAPVELGSDTHRLMLTFSIKEVYSPEELLQVRAEERVMKDLEIKGHIDFKKALDSLDLSDEDYWSGIYFRSLRTGTGSPPLSGSASFCHYKAYLSDGKLIDNTYVHEPFEYAVGKPDQAIEGFAIGVSRMREGGKALFVIPTEKAFGAEGSSSGIVPPYAALIYEVELIEVRK